MKFLSIICLSLLSFTTVLAGQSAQVVKNTKLYQQPNVKSDPLRQLTSGENLSIEQRKGGWYKVKTTTNEQGWVRLISVKFKAAAGKNDVPKGGRLWSSRGESVATGVRGLSKESASSKRDQSSRIEQVDEHAVTKQDAKAFANKAKLKSKKIDYVDPEKDN